MEPNTSTLPIVTASADASPQGGRLLVASRLATSLSLAQTIEGIASEAAPGRAARPLRPRAPGRR